MVEGKKNDIAFNISTVKLIGDRNECRSKSNKVHDQSKDYGGWGG